MDRDNPPTESLFKSLTCGGPLPKLPIEITGLKQKHADGGETVCVGRHLAYTRKGDTFVEWALFVPVGGPKKTPLNQLYWIDYS